MPRDDQPARLHAGELRRRRPISATRRRASRSTRPAAYQTRTGETVEFAGVRDLATFLAGSEETHAAFVEQLFHHLVKQPIRAFGPGRLPELQKSFAGNDFNIRKLVVEIMAASALTERK